MREAIGGTWIFQIVIFFVLLFTGYICLSINHSKAFNVKNEIVKAIEREKGVNLENPMGDQAIKDIVDYLNKTSYRTTGDCKSLDITDKSGKVITHYIGYNREGKIVENNPSFCIAKQSVTTDKSEGDLPDASYYRIVVFYQLDLPIFRSIFQFRIKGDTKVMRYTNGYYRKKNNLCQKYENGKPIGPLIDCSTVSGPIIGG